MDKDKEKCCNKQTCRRKSRPSGEQRQSAPTNPTDPSKFSCPIVNSTQILFVEPNFTEAPSEYEVFYDCQSSDPDVPKEGAVMPSKYMPNVVGCLPDCKDFRVALQQVIATATKLLTDFDVACRREKRCQKCWKRGSHTRTVQLEVTAKLASGSGTSPPTVSIDPVTFSIPLKLHMQSSTPPQSKQSFSPPSGLTPVSTCCQNSMEPIRTATIMGGGGGMGKRACPICHTDIEPLTNSCCTMTMIKPGHMVCMKKSYKEVEQEPIDKTLLSELNFLPQLSPVYKEEKKEVPKVEIPPPSPPPPPPPTLPPPPPPPEPVPEPAPEPASEPEPKVSEVKIEPPMEVIPVQPEVPRKASLPVVKVYYEALPQHKYLDICAPCRYDPSPLIDEEGRVFCPHNCGCCLCPWKKRATESQEDRLKHQKIKVCKCRERGTIFTPFNTTNAKCSVTSYFDVCPCREKAEAKYLEMYGTEMWTVDDRLHDQVRGREVKLDEVVALASPKR